MIIRVAALSLLLCTVCNANDPRIGVRWGLPDALAYVGKMFRYTVPPDAFYGDVQYYEVQQITEEPLPSWLTFNSQRRQLIGVPDVQDIDTVNVQVTAVGPRVNATHLLLADDVFTVRVREETAPEPRKSGELLTMEDKQRRLHGKSSKCVVGESQLTIMIRLDADLDRLPPITRAILLEQAAMHLRTHSDNVRLYSPSYVNTQNSDVLMAGPGETRRPQQSGVYVAWKIACGTNVQKEQQPIVRRVEEMASNGMFARRLGYPVISWEVRAVEQQARKRRRQFGYMTPTPVPTRSPYTPDIRTRPEQTTTTTTTTTPRPTTTTTPRPTTRRTTTTTTTSTTTTPRLTTTTTPAPTTTSTLPPTTTTTTTRSSVAPMRTNAQQPITTAWLDQAAVTVTLDDQLWRTTRRQEEPVVATTTSTTTQATTMTTTTSPMELFTTRRQPTTTTTMTRPPPPPTTKSYTRGAHDTRPVLAESLTRMRCVKGQMCQLLVPRDTFYDEQDGDTYNLRLSLEPLDDTDEVWLDLVGKHMVGFTMHLGERHFRLMATDSTGLVASTAFVVDVIEPLKSTQSFTHRFDVRVNERFDQFTKDNKLQLRFIHGLAKALGDSDATLITVQDMLPGSTIVQWSNNSLPVDACYSEVLKKLASKMIDADELILDDQENRVINGRPKPSFYNSFKGHSYGMEVTEVAMIRGPLCIAEPTTTTESPAISIPTIDESAEEGEKGSSSLTTDDLLYSTIIPIIVIVLLLIVATIIACVLYRRNRRHKSDTAKEAKSDFISKGLPVMFPEEIEHDQDALHATAPMLVREERPPLDVPLLDATTQGTGEALNSSAAMNGQHKAMAMSNRRIAGGGGGADGEMQPLMQQQHTVARPTTEHENPLYKPPPPIELSQTRSPRPPKHVMPGQRQPPPYVPP